MHIPQRHNGIDANQRDLFGTDEGPSPQFFRAEIDNSIITQRGPIRGARIRNSIIRSEVLIEEDVEINECIIMDYSPLPLLRRMGILSADKIEEERRMLLLAAP